MKAIIKSIQWTNSQGYDEILLKFLKISVPCIVPPLTYMCNKVLSSGIFPVDLKYFQISSIFKKVTRLKCQITGQYLYSLHFPKFLKEPCTIDCNSIYKIIMYLHKNSIVSELIPQLSQLLTTLRCVIPVVCVTRWE